MRIYSNTLLSWSQTLHVFHATRVYPGRWYHYYFYKIKVINPLIITTYSPIELLQENCKYYCYDKYHRDKRLEHSDNAFQMVNISNREPEFGKETWAYIPKEAEPDDIIVVRNDIASGYPSFNAGNWFRSDALAPPALQ